MPRYTGRITGTINDEFDIEADSIEEARQAALSDWRYVEFEDLDVSSIEEVAND